MVLKYAPTVVSGVTGVLAKMFDRPAPASMGKRLPPPTVGAVTGAVVVAVMLVVAAKAERCDACGASTKAMHITAASLCLVGLTIILAFADYCALCIHCTELAEA